MSARRKVWLFWVSEAAACVLFMAIALPGRSAVVARTFAAQAGESKAAIMESVHVLQSFLMWSELLAFLGFSLAAAVLVAAGRRRTFFIPGLVSVASLLAFRIPQADAGLVAFPFAWYHEPNLPWWVITSPVAAALGLVLVLAPASVLALSQGAAPTANRTVRAPDLLAMAACLALIAVLIGALPDSSGGALVPYRVPMAWILPSVAVFGLLLGTKRPWWPWLYMGLPFLGIWLPRLALIEHGMKSWAIPAELLATYRLGYALESWLHDVFPLIAAGLIASVWPPLSRLISRAAKVSRGTKP